MANRLVIRPEAPVTQEIQFGTDVMVALDGTEQRVGTIRKPRQRYLFESLLDEAQIRTWRAALFRDLNLVWKLPLWHDGVTVTSDVAAGASTVSGDFSLSDLQSGDDVLLLHLDEETEEAAEVDTVSSGQITIVGTTTNAYPAGSEVFPLPSVYVGDDSGYSEFPVGAARFPLEADLTRQRALGGNGAPTLATHGGLNVLDRRPLNERAVPSTFRNRLTRIDYGRKLHVRTDQAHARHRRALRFVYRTDSERQFWRAFLDAAVGRREPFYAPTWRPDLVLDSQPAGSATSITVKDEPNYDVQYEGVADHDDLQLESDDEFIRRGVASSTDNGDGTVTINLDSALPSSFSTIHTVSFLELSRLAADKVTIKHHASHAFVNLTVQSTHE